MRVAIVEDHALLAETLRVSLEQAGVPTTIVTPAALVDVHAALLGVRPDLVLLDLDLGEFGDSTTLIAPLRRAGIRTLVVTGTMDRLRIAAAVEQGAIGYQSKTAGFGQLLARTSQALSFLSVLDPAERLALLGELAQARAAQKQVMAPFERLTAREQNVLRALCDGHTVTEIARTGFVTDTTVRTHVRGILEKLGERSQLTAVVRAQRSRWFASERSNNQGIVLSDAGPGC